MTGYWIKHLKECLWLLKRIITSWRSSRLKFATFYPNIRLLNLSEFRLFSLHETFIWWAWGFNLQIEQFKYQKSHLRFSFVFLISLLISFIYKYVSFHFCLCNISVYRVYARKYSFKCKNSENQLQMKSLSTSVSDLHHLFHYLFLFLICLSLILHDSTGILQLLVTWSNFGKKLNS